MKAMRSKITLAAPVLLMLALAGCVSPNTPTEPPQVTVSNTTSKVVMDALARRAVMKGSAIVNSNDYSMTVARDGGNSLAASLFASRYSSRTEARIQYMVAQSGHDVLLSGRAMMVTNPNSAFEKSTDVTRSQYNTVLSVITEVRNEIMYSSAGK